MAKFVTDAAPDAYAAVVAAGTRMDVCTAQPTTLAEATTTYSVGNVALTAGDGNGDFTIADGDTTGRKLTVAAQDIAVASGTGDASHVAITDGSQILTVTLLNDPQTVTAGNPIQVPTFDLNIPDAV